jgi:glycine oxidase
VTGTTLIVGGGVMGLGVAWRLAQAGRPCLVLDRREPGREASWAAGGMLAPYAEVEFHEHEHLALGEASQVRWPSFAAELEAAADARIGFDRTGTLLVARDRDDAEALGRTHRYLREHGHDVDWLDGAEARRREPALDPGVPGAVWCPGDWQVDNRALVEALETAARRAGAEVRAGAVVTEVRTQGGRAIGVTLESGEELDGDAVVVAAGAWSRGIAGLPRPIPVRPVRGQMLLTRVRPGEQPLLRHVVRGVDVYLVPRADGRLVIGATSEDRGFDRASSVGGAFALIESARELLPDLDESELVDHWVGFRPASRDHGPLLGPCSMPGVHLITGHYRNGIQQAPISIDTVAAGVLGAELPPAALPFAPARLGL